MSRLQLLKMACRPLSSENFSSFINSFDNLLTDCDGVLWHGEQPVKGSQETLSALRQMGKKIFFVTNNSTLTRHEYVKKFHKLGFEASVDEIYCTSNAIAGYLQKIGFNKVVYVVGSQGICDELAAVGIRHLDIGPDIVHGDIRAMVFGGISLAEEVGAVIVGLDKDFNYVKLLKAASYLRDPSCLFIASNLDDRFPVESSQFVVPGTGAIVSAVKTASAREPLVLGKPNKGMFEAIVHQHGLDPSRTVMVGDRLDTDILLGTNCGLKTVLVLTGVSSLEDVERCKMSSSAEDKKLIPDYYLINIADINDLLKNILNNSK